MEFYKRCYRVLVFLLLFPVLGHAQTGTIDGTITTSDGQPAESITVSIERQSKGAITNKEGSFLLKNIRPGNHVLQVSAVGISPQQQTVRVVAGERIHVNFIINETAQQLDTIIINTHIQSKNTATVVAKMPLKNLENPQVYNSVPSVILSQQAIVSYDDALRNVPGISKTWGSTGRATDGASYFALRGFDAQPLLYNGVPGLTNGNLDPANVEEIQVIKGPSGTLYGGSVYAYGGMINTITKKPYFDFGGEVAYNVGSFGLHRVTGDVNLPIGKNKNAAFRLVSAYHTEKNFQDAGFKKSFFLAPSLLYKVNDRLSFQILTEMMQEERAVAPVFFHTNRVEPLMFKTIEELGLNPRLSFTSNDLTIRNPRWNVQAQALYQLSNQWTSQTVLSINKNRSSGYYTYIWEDSATDNDFGQYFHDANFSMTAVDIQQNFNGDFKIGNLRNRVLIGVDFLSRTITDKGSAWAWGRNVTPQGDVNYIEPYSKELHAPIELTKASIGKLFSPADATDSKISDYDYSAYISDVINITPKLSAMLSLRADYFDSKGEKSDPEDDYGQWAVSPKFGLVYQPIVDQLSVFANYMNGFINVAPRSVIDSTGNVQGIQSFKPEHAEQIELGTKLNLLAGRLFATLSAYDIKVKDRVSGDEHGYSQKGEVGSQGIELDITAKPVNGLNILAGYSFNETKIIAGDEKDFYSQPGRAPGGQGPQHLVNWWTHYKLEQSALKGLGIGFGGNYASAYKVVDNSATGVFNLPEYLLLNGGVSYEFSKFRLGFNVNNLTNKTYYIGYWSVNPQPPRNFIANIAYRF